MKKADLEKPFVITSVCRKDLVEAGIPRSIVTRLSDEDMTAIAQRMGDMYVAYGSFWEDIPDAFKILQIQLVMRQEMQAFSPLTEQKETAIQAAMTAGSRCIGKELGIDEATINQDELRKTALKEWQLYVTSRRESETHSRQEA